MERTADRRALHFEMTSTDLVLVRLIVRPTVKAKTAIALGIITLLQIHAYSQVPVGAGSQMGQDYLAARDGKSAENTIRRSVIVSWVQGYIVAYAQRITEEPAASEIADRIQHGDLPADVEHVLSDQRVLRILQAKFGTVSGWVFDPPDGKAVEGWLTKYCEKHPRDRISEAAATLASELESHSKTKQ
jgi:hypothetical protein